MTYSMISLVNDKKIIRKMIGAVISAVIMLVCVVGLYSYEFNISAESTVDLEQAINDYHFHGEVSADILERKAIGNRLYVLYGENEYPGACGLACLEKGIFGNYRMISCDDTESRWINVRKTTAGKVKYCITYCVNDFPEIDSYGICGVKDDPGRNQTVDDSDLIYKLDYNRSPFLTFTEISDGVTISPFHIKYYRNNDEIQDNDLESVLGPHFVEGAPNAGGGTAELGLFYILEGIIILLGIVFVRYFLTDVSRKRKE